jgi:hypothetical protein
MWIFQEVVLSRLTFVMLGIDIIPYSALKCFDFSMRIGYQALSNQDEPRDRETSRRNEFRRKGVNTYLDFHVLHMAFRLREAPDHVGD